MDSKMKPLWLVFENADQDGKDVYQIFKHGDGNSPVIIIDKYMLYSLMCIICPNKQGDIVY